ncbi:MAG: DUF192 domain-containing protein [Bacteroidota bacterium]
MNSLRNNAGAIVIGLLVVFVGSFLVTSLFKDDPKGGEYEPATSPAAPVAPEAPVFREEGKLWFVSAKGDTITSIAIEIADNEAETTQGLMYRTAMDTLQGMLFSFPNEEPRAFWMKNTPLPLDIIFADANGVIGSSQNYTTPYSEAALPSKKNAKYVVEVNAGFWDKFSLKEGDRIVFR